MQKWKIIFIKNYSYYPNPAVNPTVLWKLLLSCYEDVVGYSTNSSCKQWARIVNRGQCYKTDYGRNDRSCDRISLLNIYIVKYVSGLQNVEMTITTEKLSRSKIYRDNYRHMTVISFKTRALGPRIANWNFLFEYSSSMFITRIAKFAIRVDWLIARLFHIRPSDFAVYLRSDLSSCGFMLT